MDQQERKQDISAIRDQINKLHRWITGLEKECRALELARDREDFNCSCVKLNSEIHIYNSMALSDANRTVLSIGFVCDSLSAIKNCPMCQGKGKL